MLKLETMLREQTNPTGLRWLWIAAIIICLDQLSKVWMASWLMLGESVAILPHLNLTLAHNTGAAFSLLADAGGWQRWLFSGLAITISIILIFWLSRLHREQTRLSIALTLILGGAIGNLIDRLVYGYVIDFIDLYYGDWHFPAFNVADSAITIGALLVLLDALLQPQRDG